MGGKNICSVDGCENRVQGGLSFFRFPKEQRRCQLWKIALGITESHKYYDFAPEQCHNCIRICASHFDEDSFANSSRSRIHSYAIPSLRLPIDSVGKGDIHISTPVYNMEKSNTNDKNDACVQTTFLNYSDHKDVSTQTTMKLSANSPRKTALKESVQTLERTISTHKCKKNLETELTLDDVIKFLENRYSEESCRFLKNQLLLLNRAPKGCRYTTEFKQFALSVYFLGPKAYKKMSTLLRLPSKATLERFSSKWPIKQGFNDFVFKVIECRTKLLNKNQKDCLLCLDEMSLKSHLFYDISKDTIVGFQTRDNKKAPKFAGSALTIMARGIAGSWKQPIAYFFYGTSASADDLKDIIFECTRKLRDSGLNVLGVVSDQGSNFYKLVKSTLKLTENDTSFFVDDMKLFYLFDIPHLLKSTRNNFFSYTFLLPEGEAKKKYLEMMFNTDKTKQFKLAPRLTNDHIHPNNFQKMKVKLASQVFSHSVGVAMHTYIQFNVLPTEASTTANFILKINNFFDLLNSNNLSNFQAFMGTEQQRKLLEEMSTLFENLNVLTWDGKNVTKTMKFLYGWRMTIKSVLMLWETLKANGYKYLFTRNLNQDCIENFFGQIRNCSGNARNPTPVQFSRSFKKIFALKYLDTADGANCIDDVNEVLLNLTPEFTKCCSDVISLPTPTYTPLRVFTNDYANIKSPEGNALVYIIGYLLKKALLQHSCEVCVNYLNNTDLINEELLFCKLKAYENRKSPFGGLRLPSKDIVDFVLELEDIFINNFNTLALGEEIGSKLKNEFYKLNYIHPCENFPFDYFVSLYTRVRIYYTLKFINSDIKTKKMNKDKDKGITKLRILKNL